MGILFRSQLPSLPLPRTEERTLSTAQQIILLLSIFGTVISESNIKCKDTSVYEGENTTLSCIFSEDVNKLRQDFKIVLYSKKDTTPKVLLLCYYSESEKWKCYESFRYVYGGLQGNTGKLTVLHASPDDNGNYACVLLSHSMPDGVDKCNLTVLGLTESHSTSIPHNKPDGVENVLDAFKQFVSTVAIFGVVTGIIVILLIVVIILLIRKRKKKRGEERRRRRKEKEKKGEGSTSAGELTPLRTEEPSTTFSSEEEKDDD